jgi:hypothetical protein
LIEVPDTLYLIVQKSFSQIGNWSRIADGEIISLHLQIKKKNQRKEASQREKVCNAFQEYILLFLMHSQSKIISHLKSFYDSNFSMAPTHMIWTLDSLCLSLFVVVLFLSNYILYIVMHFQTHEFSYFIA